jgi:hypothetical protein
MSKNPVYFDVDGVLNKTPQTPEFHFCPDKVRLLLSLDRPLICLSYWRQFPTEIAKLPVELRECAPRGHKRLCLPLDRFAIDDQPELFRHRGVIDHRFIYAVDGHVGLTESDIENIRGIWAITGY